MEGERTAETAARVAAGATAVGWRRGAGFAGVAIGVVAAGAAMGVGLERLTVGRGVRRKARLELDAAGPFGTLRGTPGSAVADDGTELHYEVEEIQPQAPARRKRLFGRRTPAPVTVIFSHGYCLAQDSWHFQRAVLRGAVRAVFWDQRCHGRSARGCAQMEGTQVTIDQLGRDLKAVIDAAAPEGPVVLVGHSMGGMTMMALAAQYPELVRERVIGAAFIGTSAGKLSEVSFGLPVVGVNAVRRLLPGLLKALGWQAELVEKGRRATADLFAGVIKRYSFGSKDVDPGVARFAERLIEATPIDVVAEFYPAFVEHEKAEALPVFDGLPVLVLAGDHDLITPMEHSEAIAEVLPGASLVIVEEAGHLVILEHPEVVNGHLIDLLAQAAGTDNPRAASGGNGRRRSARG